MFRVSYKAIDGQSSGNGRESTQVSWSFLSEKEMTFPGLCLPKLSNPLRNEAKFY